MLEQAKEIVKVMEGEKIDYAIKSHGLDLYDFGFGEEHDVFDEETNEIRALPPYCVHAMCNFSIRMSSGAEFFFDAEVSSEEFKLIEKKICGRTILKADVTESHHLIIQLEDITFDFIPHPPEYYGEDVESWRFFQFGGKSEHLVVSALTIELQ